ncbi:heme NO-binding domain-containing protein [Mesobacterium pallidum]|uniref:heme NO-binding domain-containing protein n=1 Tax=Mesobacterium pallidum TaxID=2872037 RepID=UPI001EE219C7|nr:heme NO-binding domain-containing protein [Mesobacterium pallidum]
MHGLINRAIQNFVRDTYGEATWKRVAADAAIDTPDIEAMMDYDDEVTWALLEAVQAALTRDRGEVLENIGTYLVSHPNVERLRRLLRFGGVDFIDFLHSLDDLPGRARLAVSDLDLPEMELREHGGGRFSLTCRGGEPGWGHVMIGILRALADDYGALVMLEFRDRRRGDEIVDIALVEHDYAEGRDFRLAGSGDTGHG